MHQGGQKFFELSAQARFFFGRLWPAGLAYEVQRRTRIAAPVSRAVVRESALNFLSTKSDPNRAHIRAYDWINFPRPLHNPNFAG